MRKSNILFYSLVILSTSREETEMGFWLAIFFFSLVQWGFSGRALTRLFDTNSIREPVVPAASFPSALMSRNEWLFDPLLFPPSSYYPSSSLGYFTPLYIPIHTFSLSRYIHIYIYIYILSSIHCHVFSSHRRSLYAVAYTRPRDFPGRWFITLTALRSACLSVLPVYIYIYILYNTTITPPLLHLHVVGVNQNQSGEDWFINVLSPLYYLCTSIFTF